MGEAQFEFPFAKRSHGAQPDEPEDPPAYTDAELPPEASRELVATPSPQEIARRMRQRGAKRAEVLEALHYIATGERRTLPMEGVNKLIDLYELTRLAERTKPEGWNAEDWLDYLHVMEQEEEERRARGEYGDDIIGA
ncbi:MAG: hypothetical protein Q7T01_04460 [bacterium]|nr:hypothetical protein [bacterium]